MSATATATAEEKGPASGDYTEDGTFDLRGRPVLRSATGRWRACFFIVAYEIFERMAYYGIVSNLVIYLSNKLHKGTVTAANDVNNWVGTVWITPLVGAYVADAFLGRYWTFLIASAIYLLGMCLLTLAVSVSSLRPPSCGPGVKDADCDKKASALQVGIFYGALYTIAVGNGGTKPNVSTMGADQFDVNEPREKLQKLSFFNWWLFSVFLGTLFSNTFLVYIQDNVGWPLGYGLPTAGLALSVVIFLVGTPHYRHKPMPGSPLTRMAKVLVAAVRKRRVTVPAKPTQLYELRLEHYSSSGQTRLDHSNTLSFLDKAAVKTGPKSPWMLCPVTQVEQTKQMIKMIPILIATFIPSTLLAAQTLFIKQGATLDLSIGPHFKLPPACLSAFFTVFMLVSILIYDLYFVPFARKYTKNPRGITLLQRMGAGFLLHVVVMIVACFAERKRLQVARENGVLEKGQTVPLTIFILLPQFALLGVAENFVEVSKTEFFYDQAPEGMKSLGAAYFTTSVGVGYFLSSFVLSVVADITKKFGRGWVLDNLNVSRLDYYYAFFAVLSFLNFIYFLMVAKLFVYNEEASPKEREIQGAGEDLQNQSTQ